MSNVLRELQLQWAVEEGNADEIKSLAEAGVNLNILVPDGTMLMLAAFKSHWNIVELLIDLGADINRTNYFMWKFLHHAATHGWIPVIQLFIERGYDLDVTTSAGVTPLMMASNLGRNDVIKLLVNAGADVNCCDSKQWTAFHLASYNCNLEIVKFLVERITDINCQESNGFTPLHLAIKKIGDASVIRFLLRAGANCNLEDDEGTSAFRLLLERKSGNIILGIKKGGYVTATDYPKLSAIPLIQNVVLKRPTFCTLAIVNKFNFKDLPDLYKIRVVSDMLPGIEHFRINKNSGREIEINRAVTQYIGNYGSCNLMRVRPLVLSMICVESWLSYVQDMEKQDAANKRKAFASLSALDRLASKRLPRKVCKYGL